MKKFLLNKKGFFALLLALFLGSGTAYAYQFSAVSPSGHTLYYNIIDATNHFVEITYPGTLNEPWAEDAKPTGNVTLPSTVTYNGITYTVKRIGFYAFFRCSGMTGSLTIPNTVTSIREFAFQICSGLNGLLNLGNSVTEIGPYAFMECGFTGPLTLPSSLTSIGNIAFAYCSGFTGSLTIPNSVTTIGQAAFSGCTGFNGTLTIGTGVTSIGQRAFKDCSSFTHVNYNAVNCADVIYEENTSFTPFENCTGTITIGNTVQRIPSYMFYEADGLTGSLTIPNSVTNIGQCAFAGCDGFTGSLIIGDSVTTIEFGGFGWCPNFTGTLTLGSSLTTIGSQAFYIDHGFTGTLTIPNSVTTINNYAFELCNSFTGSLTIPNSVTHMGIGAFENCEGFNGTLTIGTGVTSIGYDAFKNCTGFTQVKYNATNCDAVAPDYNGNIVSPFKDCNGTLTIGNNVQIIPAYMFRECTGFSGPLTIGSSVTSIGMCAFDRCSGFTGSLTIPNTVTTIGGYAFRECTGFTGSLTLGSSLTSIGDMVFAYDNFTGPLNIPNSVTNIGQAAFGSCSGFTGTLTIPNSVTQIKNSTFLGCSGFTGPLTIPDAVTSIGLSAFDGCSGLNGLLTIGASVSSIGEEAFKNCTGLSSMMVYPETPPTLGSNVFMNVPKSIPVRVPCGKLNTYQSASGWNAFTNMTAYCDPLTYSINPDGVSVTVTGHVDGHSATGELFIPESKVIDGVSYTVTAIANFAFSECSGLTGNLVIPNTVTSIGRYAFQACTGFTGTLTLHNNLTTLSDGAFYLCSGFTGNLNLPNSLTVINKDVFAGCTGFTGSLTIPNTVTAIGNLAFSGCSGFTGSLTIPNTVTTIGKQAFCYCSGLNGTLTIGTGVTSIGNSAFCGCSSFTHVNYNAVNCADVIYEENTSFAPFENCTGTITIGNTVQRIPAYMFFEADGLTGSLTIPNSVITVGACAFGGCDGFTDSLTIGDSVTTIEFGGFGWCPNFTSLTLGSSLSYIGSQAFYVDTGLTGTLTIPNSVTYIGSCAFDSCHFTGSLTIPNSVTYIDYSAFLDCTGFSGTLTIGASLTEIGSGAFYNCTGFTQVNYNAINCVGVAPYTSGSYSSPFVSCGGTLNIGSNVQRIPAHMFKDCTGFTGSLVIPNSVTEVGANAFDNCTGFTGYLILGNSLTTIGDFAFYGMHFTGDLTIPDSVTSLGEYAFAWCGYFTGDLTIGNSLTTIPWAAFYRCVKFTNLIISNSVTSIENQAFVDCFDLASMTVRPETPPTLGTNAFNNVSTGIPVHVPCGSISDYQAADGWSTFTNYQCIPWTVTLTANPWDGGTVLGGGSYADGASCTITATAFDDYMFMQWRQNGEMVSGNASYTFTVNEDTELEAVFMPTSNAGTVIGGGEISNNFYLPSYSYYNYSLSQQIYTASELGGSFTINSISFFNAGHTETRLYDVYLVHTNKSSFSNDNDWVAVYQADCVYSGYVTMKEGMWTTIVFDTPFNYNGNDNLLLTVDDNTGDWNSPVMSCRVYTAPQSNQSIYVYNDDLNYAAHNPSSYLGDRSNVKNQIIFNRPVYTITATPNNAAMGTVNGAGQYGYGDLCKVTATANDGYTFLDWMDINGVAATDEAEYEFFVTEDRTLRANFLEGTDVCYLTFNFENYNQNWGGNYLEVHFGNGSSHLFGIKPGESSASYTLPFINGSHVELNMQIGSFTDQYHFEVRYANGNLICTSDVLIGESSYEFDVDCDEMHPELAYVGDGDDMTNEYLPSYSYYKYGLSQQIYTAAEIGSGGNITSIAFYNQGENNTKTRTYDIYLKPTSKLMFVNEHDWIGVSEEDKVFSGSVTMVPGKWTFINFDAPFVYDGTSNLVLVMDDNTGSYTGSPHMACRVFDANGEQTIRAYSDGTNYDPSNPSTYTGALVTVKNQLYFGFTQSLDCWPPMHLSSTDITSNSATLNWTGYQDSYNVRYRSVPSFYEDFEDEETFAGWTFTSMNAANDIGGTGNNHAGIYASAKHSGSYGFRFSSYYSKGEDETYDQYLISPQLTVTGELSFYFKKSNTTIETFYVGYSTTGNDIQDFTWSEDLAPTQNWQEYAQQLPSNVKYIAFHYYGDFTWYVYLDDITIGESGVSVGDWNTMSNVAGTITEITGLDPTSNYEWQVQGNDANCNDNGVTQWSKKATFTTKCEAFLVDADNPFFEDFESGTFAPDCWENIPSFDGSYYWGSSTYRSHSSSHSAYSGYYGDIYLVMPQIELTSNASEATLSFWSFNYFINDFEVGNNTVVLLDGDDETLLWSAETVASEWVETSIDLTPYLGQTITLAFKYAGNNGNAWYLDDVEVSVTPVTTVTQTIELVEGWNYVSTYIDLNEVNGIAMLEEALGDYGVTIVTFDDQAEYLGDGFWLGLEDYQLTNGEMILIEVSEDCTLTLEGPVVDPSTVEITINPEWNYIGYPLAVEMTVEEAMSAFEAEFGDGIANFEGLTEYLGEWMGDFETLVPGQGYMYYSYSDVPKTLVFSTGSKARAKGAFPKAKPQLVKPDNKIKQN